MHVFVTGGSGLTGPAIVAELVAAGHTVTGLARTDVSAQRLETLGATPMPGSLDDPARRNVAATRTLGEALIGTAKPFVSTSGTLVMPAGRVGAEHDQPDASALGAHRIPGENACLGFADHGVRASLVRLAPTVHGAHDHGFIGMLVATARKTGVSAYVGDGNNKWPAVHRLDAATLFRLALEQAPGGSVLHGVAESGVAFKSIAETIARGLDLPSISLTPDEATEHFATPFMATVYGVDAPASSAHTQQLLGWSPTHPTLLDDLAHGDYLSAPSAAIPG